MTEAFKIGSYASDSDEGLKVGILCPTNNGKYDSIEIPSGTKYQVPAGYKLIITKIIYSSSVADGSFEIGYGDTSCDDAEAAPTNAVILTGIIHSKVAFTKYTEDVIVEIPEEKYGYIRAFGEVIYCTMFGVLKEV